MADNITYLMVFLFRYGDKSPRSVVARVFAIIWIAIGITMFSMYTASLTSALTNAVMASHEVVLYQKKVSAQVSLFSSV